MWEAGFCVSEGCGEGGLDPGGRRGGSRLNSKFQSGSGPARSRAQKVHRQPAFSLLSPKMIFKNQRLNPGQVQILR